MPFIRSHAVTKVGPLHASTPVLSRENARSLDRCAEQDFGLPILMLMENAARGVAELALHLLERRLADGFLVVCGTGNNGADGLAAARLIANAGRRVSVLVLAKLPPPAAPFGDPFAVQLHLLRSMQIPIIFADDHPAPLQRSLRNAAPVGMLIDAITGTGFSTPLRPAAAAMVREINALRLTPPSPIILSVDLPSGMDADTGAGLNEAVIPDATITFAAPKKGMLQSQLPLGELYVGDLGLPAELVSAYTERSA